MEKNIARSQSYQRSGIRLLDILLLACSTLDTTTRGFSTWQKRVGRTHFIPNAINEHMHFTTGKSGMDDTYNRNRTEERGNLYEKDKVIFEDTKNRRQADAGTLLDESN